MSKKDNFCHSFIRQMNDMADFKGFGKEPTDELALAKWKVDRASRQIVEIIKELQGVLEGLK